MLYWGNKIHFQLENGLTEFDEPFFSLVSYSKKNGFSNILLVYTISKQKKEKQIGGDGILVITTMW